MQVKHTGRECSENGPRKFDLSIPDCKLFRHLRNRPIFLFANSYDNGKAGDVHRLCIASG